MQITYSGEGQIKAPLKSGAFLLVPGINEVTEEQYAELQKHPVFSRLINSGQISQALASDAADQSVQVADLLVENEQLKQRVAELEQALASLPDAQPPALPAQEMTIPELKAKLTALGISFPSTANKADLQALLPK